MSGEAAIQTDVVENEEQLAEEQIDQQKQGEIDQDGDLEQDLGEQRQAPHDEAMNEMFEKRKRQQQEERGDVTDDDDDHDDDDIIVDHDDDDDDDADEFVTLKVNGREIIKTKAEVDEAGGVVAMQKAIAGDLKLEEAAEQRRLNEIQQQENQRIIDENERLKLENERLTSMVAEEQDEPELDEKDVEKAKEMTDKMFKGDAEQLTDVMLEVVKAGKQKPVAKAPEINTAQLTAQIEADLEIKREIKAARQLFEKDNPDLNTKRLRGVVNEITKEVAKANPEMSPVEIMTESIKIARKDLNMPAPEKKDALEERKNNKRKSTDTVRQASQRRDTSLKPKKPKTKREIFDEINSGRSHK